MANWDDVWAILGELPGTERDPPSRMPAVRVRGKLVAYLPGNARSRPECAQPGEQFVVVRISYLDRAALLEENPETYFVTPHYQNYPGVLVRMRTIPPDRLRRLLLNAYRLVAPKRLVRELDP
jgi:hypothetical protein